MAVPAAGWVVQDHPEITPPSNFNQLRDTTVTEYASFLYPMASAPYTIGVPDGLWDSTDPEIREAITQAADDLWERTNQYDADIENEMAARESLAEQGIVWGDDFLESDRELFLEAVSETWEMLAEEAGGNALDYRQRVLTALGR